MEEKRKTKKVPDAAASSVKTYLTYFGLAIALIFGAFMGRQLINNSRSNVLPPVDSYPDSLYPDSLPVSY